MAKKALTSISRYGVDHFSKTDDYLEKFKNTCRNKYGVDNPGQIVANKTTRARAKQLTFFNSLISAIDKFSIPAFSFDEYTFVRDKELLWKCVTCNNTFLSNIFGKLPRCPSCYPTGNIGGQSSVELDILDEIRKFYNGKIIENSRQIISPKELDLYFPEEKFAIEVNGVYWHSKVSPIYHRDKYTRCASDGIRLLMITDNEWTVNRQLIIRMIKHRLGVTPKSIPARKCRVEQVDYRVAKKFLESNHIHGNSKASAYYGLYSEQTLLAVISILTRNRFKRNNCEIEIIRLAFGEISVIGALGKFIKEIRKSYPDSDISTYADLRYGDGLVYTKNGFIETHITSPGYWYFLHNTMYHRLSWTKKKLVSLGYDANKTEAAIMEELGALKIYDCGHKHFILRKKDE